MTPPDDVSKIPSPALLFDVDAIDRNLDQMIAMVEGQPDRLRPHIKTHKCSGVLKLQLEKGIRCIKAATLAEAELAARSGVPDVLLAYPLVGANATRFHEMRAAWPDCRFSTVVDSEPGIAALASERPGLSVFLDFDCGMHRTGIGEFEQAFRLIDQIKEEASLTFAGLHVYDGHIHETDPDQRRKSFAEAMSLFESFLKRLDEKGISVNQIVSGGSPTFAFHAERALISKIPWQCSPGTPVLWDAGYRHHFPDLPFESAAFLLTRVVSRPTSSFACLDLGHKAVSAENPIDCRVRFPAFPDLVFQSQSEEHLIVSVPEATDLEVGTELIGIPWHVCPSVALYDEARLIRHGKITGESWSIEARRRWLTPLSAY